MFEDETQPRRTMTLGQPIERLSVGDLREYVEALLAEKTRVEEEIERRKAATAAAEAVFGKP